MSSSCCAVRVAAFVTLLVVCGTSFSLVCVARESRAGCSQVDGARCQDRIGLIEF